MAMLSRHWILTSQLLQRQMANLSSLPQFHKISGNTIADEYWIGIKSLFSPIWTFCKILFRQFVDQLWPSSPNINPRLQEIFKHNRPKLSLYHIENQWIFFKWGTLSVVLPLSKTFHWNIVENPVPRYKYKKHQLIGETGRSDDEYPILYNTIHCKYNFRVRDWRMTGDWLFKPDPPNIWGDFSQIFTNNIVAFYFSKKIPNSVMFIP